MSLKRFVKTILPAIGVLGLLLALSSCSLFKTTLTIYNYSSADIDFVTWMDDNGVVHDFGDDLVWDPLLAENQLGIAIGSWSTREVSAGSDYLYFFFANDANYYRTFNLITVSAYEDQTFYLYDSTLIYELQLGGSGQPAAERPSFVPVPGQRPGR